jgi:hypothetical protein
MNHNNKVMKAYNEKIDKSKEFYRSLNFNNDLHEHYEVAVKDQQ